nr:hypothetical protein [Natribacillus halophilus]
MSLTPEDLPDIQPVRIGSTPVIRQLMEKNGKTYRFLVIQSDHMDARKEKTIQSNLEKEQRRWHKEQAELESQDFSCEADAEEALGAFFKKHPNSSRCFESKPLSLFS